jgi:hypothetical protein
MKKTLLIFITTLTANFLVAQGLENFDDLAVGSAYSIGSFTNTNSNITWSYTSSRDANGDSNSSGINLPALMLRRSSDNSNVLSSTISGGIQDFSVKLYKGFTGAGSREVELLINGVSVGTSTPFDNYNEQIFNVTGIDISGDFTIEIKNITSKQVIIDDISWTGFVNAGNNAPSISNMQRTPAADPVGLNTDVSVTADITDADLDNVATATLDWSFTDLAMVVTTGAVSMTENMATAGEWQGTIPGQSQDGTMSFTITATDDNASPAMSSSLPSSYVIEVPQLQGLQVDLVDTKYRIDFDTTVTNVNNGSFTGTGFAAVPAAGQLDANAFAIEGLQDATTIFGEEQSGNDFGKGISSGGTSSGGIYAFEVAANDYALGIQPTGNDFTPGTIHFQFTNNTGVIVTDLSLAYEVYFFNNETRSNDFICSYGPDTSNLTALSESRIFSGLESDSVPVWERNLVAIDVTGLSIPAGGNYVISWTSTDEGGGSSDEIAIDNIQIIANPSTQLIGASGTLESITLLGNLNLNAATDVVGSLNLISGVLTTNDHLTLKSSAGKTAFVAPVVSGSVNGDVIVEQFYSEQRAYRFVGSTVNMTGTLFDNWQQGGLDPGDAGYEPGIGTHITGGTLANGFDQSSTNASSAFIFNNTTQAWVDLSPTNATVLEPGEPVRLYIRGDRSISLSTAGSLPTATTIRSKGALSNGAVALSGLSTTEGGFNFIANPYQAQIDLVSLLADASTVDINPNLYYAWDPTIGAHGAYATYDFNLNTNNVAGSEVNQFLQPGQAIFIATSEDGNVAGLSPEVLVKQSFKTNSTATTNVYRSSNINELISISLFKDNELVSGKARDGVLISFNANGSNQLNSKDAIKLQNPDENLSVLKNSESLSITERFIPSNGDVLSLELTGLTGSNYTFELNNAFTGLQTLFVDAYLGTETLMTPGINLVSVSFDGVDPRSLQAARFSLKFENGTLSNDDSAFAKAVTIYPNPMTGSGLTVSNLIIGKPVVINVYNVIGQKTNTYQNLLSSGIEMLSDLDNLKSAVYFLHINQGDATTILKFIKK